MKDKISIIGIGHQKTVSIMTSAPLFTLAASKCRGFMLDKMVGNFTIETPSDIDSFMKFLNEIRPCFENE